MYGPNQEESQITKLFLMLASLISGKKSCSWSYLVVGSMTTTIILPGSICLPHGDMVGFTYAVFTFDKIETDRFSHHHQYGKSAC